MRVLYISLVSGSLQFSGIWKKILGQVGSLEELGYETHYTGMDENGLTLYTSCGEERKPIGAGRWRKRQKEAARALCGIIQTGAYDVVYIKGLLTNPCFVKIACTAKKKGCKTIFEVATFPYGREYRRLIREDLKAGNIRGLAGRFLELAYHAMAVPLMRFYTDLLILFGNPKKNLWGIPVYSAENGIRVKDVPLIPERPRDGRLVLIGVTGTTAVHGYDRVIAGISEYYRSSSQEKRKLLFKIVGNNETILPLKAQAQRLGIEDQVQFCGYCRDEMLFEAYRESDVAVSCLACHRTGLTYASPLKLREYCAAGIPFIYAYGEKMLNENTPFAMRLPAGEEPVCMENVISFYDRCRRMPHLREEERRFAETHYDWRVTMLEMLKRCGLEA